MWRLFLRPFAAQIGYCAYILEVSRPNSGATNGSQLIVLNINTFVFLMVNVFIKIHLSIDHPCIYPLVLRSRIIMIMIDYNMIVICYERTSRYLKAQRLTFEEIYWYAIEQQTHICMRFSVFSAIKSIV